MSGPSNGQTPRSSTSSHSSDLSAATLSSERALARIEKGESSTSTGRRSLSSLDQELVVKGGSENATVSPGELLGGVSNQRDIHGFRGHRSRNSGGFLLESAFRDSKHSDVLQQKAHHEQTDGKGKKRSLESGNKIEHRRSTHHRHRPKSSLGSSPLATVVTNATPFDEDGHGHGTVESPDQIPSGSSRTTSLTVSGDATRDVGPRWSGDHARPVRSSLPSLGLETDPAEIVNLALNLSESRRRNYSVGRLISLNATRSRRVVSMSQPSPGPYESIPAAGAGSSLRHHLQQQRHSSRNGSPLPAKGNGGGAVSPRINSPYDAETGSQATVLSPVEHGLGHNIQYSFSDATLSRAEKARTSMELFYEYRRLLQFLSPLKPSTATSVEHLALAPGTSVARGLSSRSLQQGRSYNPLQYVRNRKFRARERMSLDAEASGWNNIAKVRKWVDTVVDQSGQAIVTSNQMPDFQGSAQEPLHDKRSPPSSLHGHNGITGSKPRRPRLDWITTAADLLADAFWLEEGMNKYFIEDKNGNKIFPSQRSLGIPKPRASEDRANLVTQRVRGPDGRLEISPLSEKLPLSARQSALDGSSMERGRQRHQLRDPIHNLHESSASRNRRHVWHRSLTRSRSSPGSSTSDERSSRQRKRRYRDERSRPGNISSAVPEKHMIETLESEAKDRNQASHGVAFQNVHYQGMGGQVTMGSQIEPNVHRNETLKSDRYRKIPDPIRISREDAVSTPRASLDSDRGRRRGTSVDELDTTAPNSPIAHGFVPSIAINLSPPASRSTSPTKKSLTSKLNLLRPDLSKERRDIEDTESAPENDLSRKSSRQASAELETEANNGTGLRRLPSPTKKLFPRRLDDSLNREVRRFDSRLLKGERETKEPESRLRGIFKGGRIAELVGNEVSRVGDFILKRDGPTNSLLQASPASSMASDSSDSDALELSFDGLGTKASQNLSRTSTKSDDGKRSSRKATGFDQPKYHMSNLPTFKSPFEENHQSSKPGSSSPEDDPVTRQQAAQRGRGKPTRFDRLAPPRIDIRGASPFQQDETRSRWIEATDGSRVDSHRRSSSLGGRSPDSVPFQQVVRGPDKRLNAFLGPSGSIGRRGPPVTGLTGLGVSNRHNSIDRPRLEGQRQWSISDRGISAVRGSATRREIAHIRSLLLSSGIKAKEICRRANEVREPVPVFLQKISERPIPRVPRSQEHVLAARILINNIELNHGAVEDTKELFSSRVVYGLHDQIKNIDDNIQCKLTPLVRACADDADAFGAELTTTHTLAVKQLNDSVSHIMRRRRRRLKWIRRGGYVFLEWTLLGIMWWVWLVVVIIRLIRGGITGIIKGVRWILWL
ncbi:MAG: hypothetical protein M1830_007513 [Pleopsidium flavum]|nr:MAG: hypothetical protein M1830_007513 [Pleopsidium flavum]